MKFKVGDRIRCVNSSGRHDVIKGSVYTVTDIDLFWELIKVDDIFNYLSEERFVLTSKHDQNTSHIKFYKTEV